MADDDYTDSVKTSNLPITGITDRALNSYIEYLTFDEYDPGPIDPMDEVDFGNRYVVYISQAHAPKKEPEFCRHAVLAPTNYEAAVEAVRDCYLTVYGETIIAEVFAHAGTEYRFSYQLTCH
jgi:hypothetical protein